MKVYFARIEVARFRIMGPGLEATENWIRRPPRRVSFIKIGSSIDPPARVKYLQHSEYGKPIELLATMPGSREDEKAMHRRFAHLRIEKEPRMPPSEWFYPAKELMDFIRSLQESERNPGVVLTLS